MSASSALPWLLSVGASIVVAALVWFLGSALHRRLRLSHASRSYWLLAWSVAALPLPIGALIRSWTPLSLPSPWPLAMELAALPDLVGAPLPVAAASSSDDLGSGILLLIYLGGVVGLALPWLRGHRRVRRLLAQSEPLRTDQLPGPLSRRSQRSLQAAGVELRILNSPISPFALRWPRPCIVLPAALLGALGDRALGDRPLRMVLRHETAHLAQHDALWSALLRTIETLLWFNPFLRLLRQRLQLASELRCDAAAIRRDPQQRHAYAEAYLHTLRLLRGSTPVEPVQAFSVHDMRAHRMRIEHIVHGDSGARRRPWVNACLCGVSLMLSAGLTVVQAAGSSPSDSALRFDLPIVDARISSPYGVLRPGLSTQAHNGIDLAAARGTPVHAPASGRVRVAEQSYAKAPKYGSVIILDHGDGWQTLFAHLDRIDVREGEQVRSGQAIGQVGSSGQATGPHLHLEVYHQGQRVDPASVLRASTGEQ